MIAQEFEQLVDYEDFELKLEADYTPATVGQKGTYGEPLEPVTTSSTPRATWILTTPQRKGD